MKKIILVISGLLLLLFLGGFTPKNQDKAIGIQIYTLKDSCKTNIQGTLKKVADIGYKNIEMYGYDKGMVHGYTPADFKTYVNSLGMSLLSGHLAIDKDNADEIIQAAKDMGLQYIIKPWMPKEKYNTLEALKATAEEFNLIGEKVKAAGMKFGYHNHAFEFDVVEGVTVMDYLLENTKADLVTFEADLYWFVKAGKDPVDYFKRFPGRFELIHVKDMNKQKDYREVKENISTVVGTGQINFKKIMAHEKTAGVKYYFLEQERFDGVEPIEAAKRGFEYINNASYFK